MILCSYHNFPCIYYLFLHIYVLHDTFCPLIPFSTVNNISISVNNSNFIYVFLKQACYADSGPDKK